MIIRLALFWLFISSIVFTASCSNTRIVQPLFKGQWQVIGSTGGPIVKDYNGSTQPTAFSNLGAAYGLTTQTTIYSSFGVSAAARNIYQFDVGFTYEILPPYNYQPGISISPMVNYFRDNETDDHLIYPQLDLNAYWPTYYRHDFVYVGMSNWFELAQTRAHDLKQKTRWIPAFHTGYTFQTERYGLSLELKYIAPHKDNRDLIIDYSTPDNKGAVAIYVAISRKFN